MTTMSNGNFNNMNKSLKKNIFGIAFTELKKMFWVYLIGDILLILASVVYFINDGFDYRLLTGIAAGTVASIGYYLLLGFSAEKALMRKNDKKARASANLFYGFRYVGLFSLFVILLIFKAVNLFTLIIPLFFPRIYYMLSLIKKTDK